MEGTSDDLNLFVMLSIKVENFKKIEQLLREELLNPENESEVEVKDDDSGKNKENIINEANPL